MILLIHNLIHCTASTFEEHFNKKIKNLYPDGDVTQLEGTTNVRYIASVDKTYPLAQHFLVNECIGSEEEIAKSKKFNDAGIAVLRQLFVLKFENTGKTGSIPEVVYCICKDILPDYVEKIKEEKYSVPRSGSLRNSIRPTTIPTTITTLTHCGQGTTTTTTTTASNSSTDSSFLSLTELKENKQYLRLNDHKQYKVTETPWISKIIDRNTSTVTGMCLRGDPLAPEHMIYLIEAPGLPSTTRVHCQRPKNGYLRVSIERPPHRYESQEDYKVMSKRLISRKLEIPCKIPRDMTVDWPEVIIIRDGICEVHLFANGYRPAEFKKSRWFG